MGVEGVDRDGKRFSETSDVVVLALPAPAAASLLDRTPLATSLQQVIYRPVATTVVDYSEITFPTALAACFCHAEAQ